ncbi:MAG: hypothetical protein NTW08_03575 [Gammaproteobacteria bacterium]|nr:hypothetical protein [Gammaproteobacteria bacterium]
MLNKKHVGMLSGISILICLMSFMASAAPYFENNAPPSLADGIHLSRAKDPADLGMLPVLTGLPDKAKVAQLTQHAVDVMLEDKDPRCTSINPHLRTMVFQHFVIYQHLVNAQQVYFNEQTAHQWSHLLAMILEESSGDSANITDMSGHTIATNDSKANLHQWREILALSKRGHVQLNDQTNFGLTQTSTDRLFAAFRLAKDQKEDTAFLEGEQGAKHALNTASAIRKLIWFYQDFAQGRIMQSQGRIHHLDVSKPAYSERYKAGLEMALLYCGTHYMFRGESLKNQGDSLAKLRKAMASISYCRLGNQQAGYGVNEIDEKCFAEWVTLCPALNIDIATLTPLSYFATRGAHPVCEDTFKRLIKKRA